MLRNNALLHEQDKFLCQHQHESVQLARQIQINYFKGLYSESVEDSLVNRIRNPAPLYAQESKLLSNKKLTIDTSESKDSTQFGSVALANFRQKLKKDYLTQTENNFIYSNNGLQPIPEISVFDLFKILLLILMFGLLIRFIGTVLLTWLSNHIKEKNCKTLNTNNF